MQHMLEIGARMNRPRPKTLRTSMKGLGFRGLGFRGLGFRGLGFRVSGLSC